MPLLFADDTNLYARWTNIKQLQNAVTNDLNSIAEWSKVTKTYFMIFFHEEETASTWCKH